jgi:hypothetical protein
MAKTTRRRRPTQTTVPSDYFDTGEPVRPAQRQFIDDLLRQRFVPENFNEQELLDRYNTNRIDKHGASALIDALRTLPRVYRGGRAAGGRALTNRVSRKVGCGAICATKTGWYDEYTITLLEEAAQREGANHHE